MCVVYLLSSKTEANKDHGRMVISKDKEKIQSVPFAELTQAVASRSAHLLNAILYEFMLRHIPVSFVDGRGHIVGQLDSSEYQLQRLSAQRRATAYADIEQAAPQMELFFTDNYANTRGNGDIDSLPLCTKKYIIMCIKSHFYI